MATDTRLSDDDIRAAARIWFRNFGTGFRNVVDDLKPGVFRETASQFAHDLLNPQPNTIYTEPAPLQRKMAAIDGLEMAGYSKPFSPADIERMLTAMEGPVADYVEAAWHKLTGSPRTSTQPTATEAGKESEQPLSASFSENIEAYFASRKRSDQNPDGYSAQTIIQQQVAFRLWCDIIGEKLIIDYRRADVGRFRETLLRIPASFGKGRETDPLEAIAKADALDAEIRKARLKSPSSKTAHNPLIKRMTGRTVKRHFSALSQYWQYLSTNGLTGDATNLFHGWSFPGTKKKGVQKRDIWDNDDLISLFNSEYWKTADFDSAIHWLPIIALHSGMRVEEIANLRVTEDIRENDGILYFSIQEHLTVEEVFDKNTKTWGPKTTAGIRRVPVHSWLIKHGIKELISLRKNKKTQRLFPELKPSGPDKKFSASYSREFSRQKKALIIPDRVVFHSFRTTFRNQIAQSAFGDAYLDAVTGHETPKVVPGRHVDAVAGVAGEGRGVGAVYERPKTFRLELLQSVVETFVSPLAEDLVPPIGEKLSQRRNPL